MAPKTFLIGQYTVQVLFTLLPQSFFGRHTKSRRVILAMTSSVFEVILLLNHHPKPMLFLRRTKSSHLKLLMSYIYHGEVEVSREDLEDFLDMAGELKIKGLITDKSYNTSTGEPRSKSQYTSEQMQM